ncbi:hypothetical protein CLU79DRAFT_765946 [Phycomyces nitens]|nr:hypothetical protein CLU79DRAFT_765946 [Phycomyces nitens]
MDFEDLMDMEWLNNHTEDMPIKEEPLDSYYTFQNYYEEPECSLAGLPYLSPGAGSPELADDEGPPLIMPTTDQIRQLIDMAKRQLALREQEQSAPPTSPTITSTPPNTTAPLLFPEPIQALQTVAPEDLIKTEPKRSRRDSSASACEDVLALEACAEADGIDIKKLTPKERRQLRNKISARNFRVRRKEYITTLEGQVDKHKKHAERLQDRLGSVEDENRQLRTEVDTLRRQNQMLQKAAASSSSPAILPSSVELTRTPSSPRPGGLKPNLRKDISILGTKAQDYRQDNYILVSNAIMPNWDLDTILSQTPTPVEPTHTSLSMQAAAGHFIALIAQMATHLPLDQTITKMPSYYEEVYDGLIMTGLIDNVQSGSNVTDKSFWWWDAQPQHA